jgi:nicotinate-nucleotide adenylyltransferase
MKIGVLGGTFDPVHNGHIELARKARDEFSLDKVMFMPAGNPYLKDNILRFEERLDILHAALGDEFEISLLEADQTKPTYSCDTFEFLHKTYENDSFYFILGFDCLNNFDKWREPARILANCEIIAASREGTPAEILRGKADELQEKLGGKIHILNFPDIDISSTKIRGMVKEGRSVKGLLPDLAIEKINELGCYK